MRAMGSTPRYWFPAKKHGWGWGMPRTWEGWLVLVGYVTVLLVPVFLFPGQPAVTVAALVIGTSLLLWLCVKKGEPPRWRWGSR